MVEAYLVGHLVQDARDAEQQERPRVPQHLLQQFPVYAAAQFAQLGQEAQRDAGHADEVHHKDVAYLIVGVVPRQPAGMRLIQPRSNKEDKQIQPDVAKDEQQFQGGELDRPALETQQSIQYRLEGIYRHHTPHHGQELGMCVVAQRMGDGLDKAEEQQ